MQEKIERTIELIQSVISRYQNPCVLSSFGKDSMVMLDLVKRSGNKLPIVFHREPFFPEKYQFANEVILRESYSVYDYAPSYTEVVSGKGQMEIVSYYQSGRKCFNYMPTGIKEFSEDKPFLCGYRDVYLKPTGTFEFPWDLGLVGHKNSDCDPILGHFPLKSDFRLNQPSGADYCFPLRYFSDAEIWAYTLENGIPWNQKRYDRENGFKEFPDITFNPDYFPMCVRCLDKNQPAEVFCPVAQREISNISSQVRHWEPTGPMY